MKTPLHERLAALLTFVSPPSASALSPPALELLDEAVKALTPPTTMGQISPTAVEMPWPNLPAGSRLVTSAYPRSVVSEYGNARAAERDVFWRSVLAAQDDSSSAGLNEDERAELERLRGLVNSPETRNFLLGVRNEVAHQVERWGTVHDRAKEPQDWFWLLVYLGGKALKAHAEGDTEKALHHCISSAAVLANWHLHVKIGAGLMQPGSSDLQDFIRETFGANFVEAQGSAG